MKSTRLFHISGNRYSPVSFDHHTFRIWEELAKGFDSYHVIARNVDNRYSYVAHGKIHLHLLPSCGKRMGVFFFLSWVLPYFVWRYRPTHLLAQSPVMGGVAAAFCSRVFNVPLFVEIHGASYFEVSKPGIKGLVEHFLYRALSPYAFKRCARIRSLSSDMTDRILKVYGPHLKQKIVMIPVRVDVSIFKGSRTNYKVMGPLKVMMVGSLCENKNQIQLVHDLGSAGIDIELTLAGEGPCRDSLELLASRDSDNVRIMLVGQLNHECLREVLACQDVYVHYAHSEGTPRAILEAMALMVPVITVDYPYMRGVVEDGENVLLISKPDPIQLAGAIRRLIGSERLRQKLGENGRRLVHEKFESDKVFEMYRNEILGTAICGCSQS